MKLHFKVCCAFLLTLVLSTSVCSQKMANEKSDVNTSNDSPKVKVTYIANEGVLVESARSKFLIDGLHRFYKTPYAFPPDDLRNLLEGAKSPYDNIDLVLVSHIHGDHFHAKSVANHLQNTSKGVLATSIQIVDEIKKESKDYGALKGKIKEIGHEWKKSFETEIGELKVKFLGLRHAGDNFRWIQNFGHVVEIAGNKFLHLGDADMTDENFASFKLSEEEIDVAFIPYWFLLSKEGRALVKRQFNPKHIVAVHVSPSEAAKVTEELKSFDPRITVFTKILETKEF